MQLLQPTAFDLTRVQACGSSWVLKEQLVQPAALDVAHVQACGSVAAVALDLSFQRMHFTGMWRGFCAGLLFFQRMHIGNSLSLTMLGEHSAPLRGGMCVRRKAAAEYPTNGPLIASYTAAAQPVCKACRHSSAQAHFKI